MSLLLQKVNTDLGATLSKNTATPFLKWVGGKRSILEQLKVRLPKSFNDYYESFIGGGALFFDIAGQIRKAYLSDINSDLMIAYKVIQKRPEALIEELKQHQRNHNEKHYYRIRAQHNLNDRISIASRLVYLNKTCFNGLYRVNKKGEFNVPMGNYVAPRICNEDNIRACSETLRRANIANIHYTKIKAKAGDFCYFDPPYHPVNKTSFTAYTQLNFSENDQIALANFCKELHKKGVKIMVSNSNTMFIRNLYKSKIFKIDIVHAPRFVNCKANGRKPVKEVIITNY
ncbi:MAG: dam [Chitinophagaceae bacterium]|nr:dam [Chitinophagaceae bacterium]